MHLNYSVFSETNGTLGGLYQYGNSLFCDYAPVKYMHLSEEH